MKYSTSIFERFINYFEISSANLSSKIDDLLIEGVDEDFIITVKLLGGKSFKGGLYRVLSENKIEEATTAITKLFPKYKHRIVVFGYDWLGRYFAIDRNNLKNGKPLVLMLETGAGEVMQIPVSIIPFHNEEVVDYTNDALAFSFYKQWQELNPEYITPDKCVGYKTPLFLGGKDTIDNLELIDLTVYVSICAQLRNQTLTLQDGQKIGDITIS